MIHGCTVIGIDVRCNHSDLRTDKGEIMLVSSSAPLRLVVHIGARGHSKTGMFRSQSHPPIPGLPSVPGAAGFRACVHIAAPI
jgi:hypothetical protein